MYYASPPSHIYKIISFLSHVNDSLIDGFQVDFDKHELVYRAYKAKEREAPLVSLLIPASFVQFFSHWRRFCSYFSLSICHIAYEYAYVSVMR